MLQFNQGSREDKYYAEKIDSNVILQDVSNLENIEQNEKNLKPYLIKNNSSDYDYKIKKNT